MVSSKCKGVPYSYGVEAMTKPKKKEQRILKTDGATSCGKKISNNKKQLSSKPARCIFCWGELK